MTQTAGFNSILSGWIITFVACSICTFRPGIAHASLANPGHEATQASVVDTASGRRQLQQGAPDDISLLVAFEAGLLRPPPPPPAPRVQQAQQAQAVDIQPEAQEEGPWTSSAKPYHSCNDSVLLANLRVPVVELWHASRKFPGFFDVQSDADLKLLYELQLAADLAHWRGRPLTMASLDALVAQTRQHARPPADSLRRVAIVRNRLYWLNQHLPPFNTSKRVQTMCAPPCNLQFFHFQRQMRRFLSKTSFPDVVFEYSVADLPTCRIKGRSDKLTRPRADSLIDDCAAPIFAMQKTDSYADILVPILRDSVQPLIMFPFDLKSRRAFLRAAPSCDEHSAAHQGLAPCARSHLARRSASPGWGRLLEAGLTKADNQASAGGGLNRFPLIDHARFKILLDTDGLAASFRLTQLLHINSAVFKQASPYYEWYGKLLQDGTHYVSFWNKDKDDLYEILQKWRLRDVELQNISFNAMHLVYRYTSPRARMLYWRHALQAYKALFTDMDSYIAGLGIAGLAPGEALPSAGGAGTEQTDDQTDE